MLPPVFVYVPLLLLVASAAVLALALRGRRVDFHPVCRRCGYDLVGQPAGRDVCTECGAGLSGRRAVRIGHRRRHRRVAAGAVSIAAGCCAWFGLLGWSRVKGHDFDDQKPTWWLLAEAARGQDRYEDSTDYYENRQLSHLTRRFVDGRLTDGQVDDVAAEALRQQAAGVLAVRDCQWLDFLELAHATGRLSDARWRKYATQATPQLAFTVRRDVRPGEMVPAMLVWTGRAAVPGQSTSYQSALSFVYEFDRTIDVDGRTIGGPASTAIDFAVQPSPGQFMFVVDPGPDGLAGVADGPHRATARVTAVAYTGPPAAGRVVCRVPLTLTAPCDVSPAAAPPPSPARPAAPAASAAVRSLLTVQAGQRAETGEVCVYVAFPSNARPPVIMQDGMATFSFRAFVRPAFRPAAPEVEVGTGTLSWRVENTTVTAPLPDIDARWGLDVILRPCPDPAAPPASLNALDGEADFPYWLTPGPASGP